MKIRVTFASKEIKGNEVGEIHDKQLSENFMQLLIRFLRDNSLVYGKKIGAWEVKEDELRLCVEGENKDIICYACEVKAELFVHLTVIGQRPLEDNHVGTELLKAIMAKKVGRD